MRTAEIDQALLLTISSARLTKYLAESSNDLDAAIALYEVNTKLSEAFYFPLQCCEVCFRNTLHDKMASKYGERWFEDSTLPLTPESESQVQNTLDELSRRGSENPSAGTVVAELKFSFWVGLLGPKYDNTLWRHSFHKAFSVGQRKTVHGRFNAIRRFRNRVFHHEPIFHSSPDVKHREIIEAIRWICPNSADWAEHNSRVPSILRA